ncbi:MAG: chemotaxis protein CheB [Bryobacterales bacterium]
MVGVGASAGGLEAFTELLEGLPDDTGMAFVLVSHLSHTHKSMLSELLARATRMPVKEAGKRTALSANHVYVIPPNMSLSLSDGYLVTKAIPQGRRPVMVIDSFLRSLAEKRGSQAIGVILSGTGTDGTLGLAAIKAAGGVTFAQDERSAKYSDMPRSASAEPGAADFILPPPEIARQLARVARHPYVKQAPPDLEEQPGPRDQLAKVFSLIRTSGGVDFSCYKPTTIKRRISRRMLLRQIDSLEAYVARLRQDPAEVEALSKDLLINVTGFFRDPDTFQALSDAVIPKILEGREPNDPVRVWVAGCSSGEEAYSIAICLLEAMEKRGVTSPIQIFATDVDKDAIEKAREGRYRENIAADVSPERLRAYFTKTTDGYRISKRVRDLSSSQLSASRTLLSRGSILSVAATSSSTSPQTSKNACWRRFTMLSSPPACC